MTIYDWLADLLSTVVAIAVTVALMVYFFVKEEMRPQKGTTIDPEP
jgi:hypothetical protein